MLFTVKNRSYTRLFSVLVFFAMNAVASSEEEGKAFAEKMLTQQYKLEASFAQDATLKSSAEDISYAKEINKAPDVQEVGKELEFLTGKLPAIGNGCKDCGSRIENVESVVDDSNVTLVFVSFSMPKAALQELSSSAEKHNAKLVMRGIHEGSFIKTKEKVLEVSNSGLGFDINPSLFKEYGVKRVLTFVLVENGKEVNRLSGNVKLDFAISKLREERVLAGHAINGVAE